MILLAATAAVLAVGCGESSGSSHQADAVKAAQKVPDTRANPNPQPVQEYRVKLPNRADDWYFLVQLFETAKTFEYRVKLQYEEVRGEDTIRIPNMGTEPKPVLKKGDEENSCIIGFIDNKGVFREYKKAYFKDDQLGITTLKHYSVTYTTDTVK
jgi:hypothetical protein